MRIKRTLDYCDICRVNIQLEHADWITDNGLCGRCKAEVYKRFEVKQAKKEIGP